MKVEKMLKKSSEKVETKLKKLKKKKTLPEAQRKV